MPRIEMRIQEIVDPESGLPHGHQALQAFSEMLERSFNISTLSDFDPLKVVVNFEGVEDVGITFVGALCNKLYEVWQRDYSWYAAFRGLEEGHLLFETLSHVLRWHKLSIACEGKPDLLCGVNQADMTRLDSPYYEDNWRRMGEILIYLQGLENDTFVTTPDVLREFRSRGYSENQVRSLLNLLDQKGLIVARNIHGRRGMEYAHILRYLPAT